MSGQALCIVLVMLFEAVVTPAARVPTRPVRARALRLEPAGMLEMSGRPTSPDQPASRSRRCCPEKMTDT